MLKALQESVKPSFYTPLFKVSISITFFAFKISLWCIKSRACGMHGNEKKSIQSFSKKTQRKEATLKVTGIDKR
jgi:uncharacterized protein YqhQ